MLSGIEIIRSGEVCGSTIEFGDAGIEIRQI